MNRDWDKLRRYDRSAPRTSAIDSFIPPSTWKIIRQQANGSYKKFRKLIAKAKAGTLPISSPLDRAPRSGDEVRTEVKSSPRYQQHTEEQARAARLVRVMPPTPENATPVTVSPANTGTLVQS